MPISVTSLSKLSVLLLLLQKPCCGYELIGDIRKKFGYNVSAGQIYPFLASLSKAKLIRIEESGDRDKKIYSLTSTGKAFAREVLESFDGLVEVAISKKIHKCSHCECKVFGKSHCEKIKGKLLYFCCSSCANSLKRCKK
ncbi:MAG: PadR family transcriptional regulator [Candidatus Micrarchaeota archaeon]